MFITLKPIRERRVRAEQVIARLRQKTAGRGGISLVLQASQDIRVGGRFSRAQFQYALQSTDLSLLNQFSTELLGKLRKNPLLQDVNSDQQTGGLQANVVIDRDAASRLGISPAAIDSTLYDAFGQRQVSTIFTQLNQYHVVLEADPKLQLTPDALNHIYIHAAPAGGNAGSAQPSEDWQGGGGPARR